jgi:hypothetical protein
MGQAIGNRNRYIGFPGFHRSSRSMYCRLIVLESWESEWFSGCSIHFVFIDDASNVVVKESFKSSVRSRKSSKYNPVV